jgi:hypothetical protein
LCGITHLNRTADGCQTIYHKEESNMKKNVGNVERVLRIIAGAAILSFAFVGPQSPWAYLGIIPLATGLVGWCPPYALLGISSCKTGGCGNKAGGSPSAGSSSCGKN